MKRAKVCIRHNHGCLLFGVSWGHVPAHRPRLTHIYLGPWVLTVAVA